MNISLSTQLDIVSTVIENVRSQFENTEKSKRTKHGDTKGTTAETCPHDFESRTNNNDTVKTIELNILPF